MVECDEHWMAFINKNPNCISFVLHSSHYPLRVRSSYSILPLSLSLSHTPLCGFVSNLQFEYVEDVHPHSPNLLYTYIENTSLVCTLWANRTAFHHLNSDSSCENTQNNYMSIHKQMHLNWLRQKPEMNVPTWNIEHGTATEWKDWRK